MNKANASPWERFTLLLSRIAMLITAIIGAFVLIVIAQSCKDERTKRIINEALNERALEEKKP